MKPFQVGVAGDLGAKMVLATIVLGLLGAVHAAPRPGAGSLEAAALQLGTAQAQAQYAAAALQGARAASRSAASCLVTAVQYTHGQQIWRPDPCEFCLCLDGEMFCWWQECSRPATGPCALAQPYTLCGNSSSSFDIEPPKFTRKTKKYYPKKTTPSESTTKKANTTPLNTNTKPLITSSNYATPSYKITNNASPSAGGNNESNSTPNSERKPKKTPKLAKNSRQTSNTGKAVAFVTTSAFNNINMTTEILDDWGSKNDENITLENGGRPTEELALEATSSGSDASLAFKIGVGDERTNESTVPHNVKITRTGCLVMGTEYRVGQALPSTGSCLACRCGASAEGPRVTCAPRGCAPPDTQFASDDPGVF